MRVLAALVLVGCASGRASIEPPDADTTTPPADAPDAPVDAKVDARVTPMADAKVDAQTVVPPDAPPDAYVCQVMTRELLTNPVFDLSPTGTGWVQQNIDNTYPIVTSDEGVPEHSAPYKAWMGGWTGQQKNVSSVTDVLYQDVAVPAGTTQLVLTGYYEVRTGETDATAYDTAQLALTQTNGTPIQVVMSLSNLTPTTSWTGINHAFTQNLSGQTVRLRMTTTNDVINATSFYFDTLALTATYCQ